MPTGERRDPFRAFNFQLEIDNIARGAFSECSGLTAEGRRGGLSRRHRLATQRAQARRAAQVSTNITLKRGYTQDDTSLWDWYKNIHNGVPDRRNVTIILMNEERQPVMRWHAENAWINKIEGPSFKASGNEVAIESVELVHEGLTIEV